MGPRKGLTHAWVATAPTPARTQGQIAPTARTLVETAMPSIPVERSRATIEKVTAHLPGRRRHRRRRTR